MSAVLTVQYRPDFEGNLVPDGKVTAWGAQMVDHARGNVGAVVDVAQVLLIDELRMRVARGEFLGPVDIRCWDENGMPHTHAISEYGTIPWSALPDPSLDRSTLIIKTATKLRKARKAATEETNGND